MEPTSPLREAKDIDSSIKKIKKIKGQSLISVSKCKASHANFQFRKKSFFIKPIMNKKSLSKTRQELDERFYIDGSIYLSRVDHIVKKKSFYSDKTVFEMPKWKSIEIDDKSDFIIAEYLKKMIICLKK